MAIAKNRNEIAAEIIQHSIQIYPGNCPCPESRDKAGRRCGKRSAYYRRGGYKPICYVTDVTDEIIFHYLQQHAP